MNEVTLRAYWEDGRALAPAVPAEIVFTPSTLSYPDFRGIDAQDRAMLGVAPSDDGGFDPDGLQLHHEQGHALHAVAPLDALLTYWWLRGLDGVCTPQEAYALSFAAAARGENGKAWGLRPHERFAETFAVLTHPIPAIEREWPAEWDVPLTEARRDALRSFYAGLPRRAKPWYVPISAYYPPQPAVAMAAAPPDPTLDQRIAEFWARMHATPADPLTHAELIVWAENFQAQLDRDYVRRP